MMSLCELNQAFVGSVLMLSSRLLDSEDVKTTEATLRLLNNIIGGNLDRE